jgi:hypothetical protein
MCAGTRSRGVNRATEPGSAQLAWLKLRPMAMLAVGWFRHNRYFVLSGYPVAAAFRRGCARTFEIALEGPESAAFAMQTAAMLGLCYSDNTRAANQGSQRLRCWGGGPKGDVYPARKRDGSTTGLEASAMRFIGRIGDCWRWDYPRNQSAPGRNHAHS